jgi:DNA-binding SARP family transcriptional activator
VEISLLGPLEVLKNGAVITPSAPKLRRVLSILVIHANEVIRRERLVDELWDDDPPTSVTTTIQTYIYQLRKQLRLTVTPEPGGAVAALHTAPNGYQLTLDPAGLDFARFAAMAERGQDEVRIGKLSAAGRTFSDALRLWRGPALVDVPLGPGLRAEAMRLEEMRANVLERRLDVDLQLGRHQELLGELTSLAAHEPTNERYQGMLMLALHRSGRRGDALRVYQRTRAQLADDLGLDPSNDLQQLQRAVLASDPSLDAPIGPERVTIRSGPPRQLPPDSAVLIGRSAQLALAADALAVENRPGPAVVVIVGPPGSGTSALCIRAGHQSRDRYPDGQLCARLIDLDGLPVRPGDVLGEFLRAMGVPDSQLPVSTDERAGLFRTITADKRMLLVLDDVVDAEQLHPLLPSGGCGVLLTSRRRLFVPSVATTIQVPQLTTDESMRVLTALLGPDRVGHREPSAAATLVDICDRLPMALHNVATRLQERPHWSISRLVGWIRREAVRTDFADDPLGLRASVERTYRTCQSPARQAFRALAGAGLTMFSLPEAGIVLGLDDHHAEHLLEQLVEQQLIEAEPAADMAVASYRFLGTIRAVGRWIAGDDEGFSLRSRCAMGPQRAVVSGG